MRRLEVLRGSVAKALGQGGSPGQARAADASKSRLRLVAIASALLVNLGCVTTATPASPLPSSIDPSPASTELGEHASEAQRETRERPETVTSAVAPAPREVVELGGPTSELLSCGLANPMPGGVTAGYAADTGLDLAGSPRDVFAIASGKLDYAEAGHTLWNGRRDSPYAVRLELDEPIVYGEHKITHVWYAHLSEVAREVHEGSDEVVHVRAGERLGRSGSANGSPHLHLGMLLDGQVEQSWGTFLLEDGVRAVLCGWGKGKRLPEARLARDAVAEALTNPVARRPRNDRVDDDATGKKDFGR